MGIIDTQNFGVAHALFILAANILPVMIRQWVGDGGAASYTLSLSLSATMRIEALASRRA